MNTVKRFAVFYALLAIAFIVMAGNLSAQDVEKININTATVQELSQLKKVGPKLAQVIIDYREKNGPFAKIEDIKNVKGIGPAIWELLKDRITVGADTAAEAEPVSKDETGSVSKVINQVTEAATPLAGEVIKGQKTGGNAVGTVIGTAVKSDKVTQLESKVMELENKVKELEKKIAELEKKTAKP